MSDFEIGSLDFRYLYELVKLCSPEKRETTMTQEPTISAKYGKKVRGQECDGEFDLTVSLTANAKVMYSLLSAALMGINKYRTYLREVERESEESTILRNADNKAAEIKLLLRGLVGRAKKLDEQNDSFVYAYLDGFNEYGA